jgi:hypothetical protein
MTDTNDILFHIEYRLCNTSESSCPQEEQSYDSLPIEETGRMLLFLGPLLRRSARLLLFRVTTVV